MHDLEIKQFGDRCKMFRDPKPVVLWVLIAILAMMVAPFLLKVW